MIRWILLSLPAVVRVRSSVITDVELLKQVDFSCAMFGKA